MDDADSNPSSSGRASAPKAAFRRAFARQWQESVRYFGFWRTLWELAAACWRVLIELLPSRRKARFGDLDYDWDHNVDTTRSNAGFRSRLLAELVAGPYFATEPWLFEQMMQALPVHFQDFTFVDLGSGKGRALLMAAPYGFRRIVGVELMPEWHRTAQENIRKFVAENQSAPPIESLCLDARDFDFAAGPLVVYLFNPFPEPVFAAVMERLRQSVLKKARPVFVAYRYVEFEGLLQKFGWLEKVAGAEQWAVYQNRDRRT
jgi:SAM-dependent methyltransferase